MHTGARGDAGFSLLEAIVALLILAAVVVPLMGSVNHSQASTRYGSARTEIAWNAQAYLEWMMARDFASLTNGTTSINYATDYQTYNGTIVVSDEDCDGDSTPDADCKRIEVELGGVTLVTLRVDD